MTDGHLIRGQQSGKGALLSPDTTLQEGSTPPAIEGHL